MYDAFFAQAEALRAEGVPFAIAVVVRADAPTSGKPGDKAIVTAQGIMHGWIGGSCAQPAVVEEARRAIADDRCRLIRLTPESEPMAVDPGMEVRAMTCYSGGTLDVYIEPQQPQPRLVIVGNLPTAQALVQLGKAMSYRVIAIDPTRSGAMSAADVVGDDLADIDRHASPVTAVVVATHGNGDEEALERALTSSAPYVGLVASPRRAAQLRRYLGLRGLPSAALERLDSPAGLDIGARRGDEIALSILARIVEQRRAAESFDWPDEPAIIDDGDATAVDPICGMTVAIAGAAHTAEHDGATYYFCCAGCRTRFEDDPAAVA